MLVYYISNPKNGALEKSRVLFFLLSIGGDVVRIRRHEIGYSQMDVERIVVISHQTYSNFENGKHGISADRFVAICKLFRLKMSDFYDCELKFSKLNHKERLPSDKNVQK